MLITGARGWSLSLVLESVRHRLPKVPLELLGLRAGLATPARDCITESGVLCSTTHTGN